MSASNNDRQVARLDINVIYQIIKEEVVVLSCWIINLYQALHCLHMLTWFILWLNCDYDIN